jgi:hypothetical protein
MEGGMMRNSVLVLVLVAAALPVQGRLDSKKGDINMKLEELIQNLDAASPWLVKDVEKILKTKLTIIYSSSSFISYGAGQSVFEEGLIIEKAEIRIDTNTKEMIRLILHLDDNASCFTRERLKKPYPDIQIDLRTAPRGDSPNAMTYYDTKRPWGTLAFGFKVKRPSCLAGITFVPTKWE